MRRKHQHFNTGQSGVRYYAITEGDFPKRPGIPLEVEQIEPEHEDPSVRRRFEAELGHERTGEARSNPGLHHPTATLTHTLTVMATLTSTTTRNRRRG